MKSQIALSALLRGITSNHDGDFYCLNFFQSYSTEKNLKKHGIVCNDHDYCYVEKPDEYNKILKYNHGEKLLKAPAIIYADLKILIQRKKLSIRLLVIHCLQIVHVIQQKISLFVTKVKAVWKDFVKT